MKAQQSSIFGVVSIHNSETETGIRKYVHNASVEDDFGKAQPTITDQRGRFRLIFVGLSDNTSVSYKVNKSGLEVVNISGLSAITGQKDSIRISMASPAKIAEYRRRIYNVGKTEAEKRLERLMAKKNKEISELRKNEVLNSSKIEELRIELRLLQDQGNRIEEQVDELAKQYAFLNLDDVSPTLKHAFILFQNGNLDSALHVINQINFERNVEEILALKQRTEARSKQINEILHFKAVIHTTRFEFDSARVCYSLLLRLDSADFKNLAEYSHFLAFVNENDAAIYYQSKAMNVTHNQFEKFTSLNNLGLMYLAKNDFFNAEESFFGAVKYFESKVSSGDSSHLPFLANSQVCLGKVWINRNQYIKCDSIFASATKIYKKLVDQNPELYLVYKGALEYELGNLRYRMKELSAAEDNASTALDIFMKLNDKYPNKFLPEIYNSQILLGNIYVDGLNLIRAESFFLNALAICEKQVMLHPQSHQSRLGQTYNALGNVYKLQFAYAKAKAYYSKADAIYRRLFLINPLSYQRSFGIVQKNLGFVLIQLSEFENAKFVLESANEVFLSLDKSDARAYKPELASLQENLGMVYTELLDFEKAESAFKNSIALYEELIIEFHLPFKPELKTAYDNLGVYYHKRGMFKEAISAYAKAMAIARELVTKDGNTYEAHLAFILTHLGSAKGDMSNFRESERFFLEAHEIYERLTKRDPRTFEPFFAIVKKGLGDIYALTRKFDLAETYLCQCAHIWRKYIEGEFTAYKKGYAEVLIRLLFIYKNRSTAFKTNESEPSKSNYCNLFEMISDFLWLELQHMDFVMVEEMANVALRIDSNAGKIKAYLAHALLFQNKYDAALKVYESLRNLKNESRALLNGCIKDLEELQQIGIMHKDLDRIKLILAR